jgi:hypothetical protein
MLTVQLLVKFITKSIGIQIRLCAQQLSTLAIFVGPAQKQMNIVLR